MPEPLALPSAGSSPYAPAAEAPGAGEITPSWHDLVEPANLPALSVERLPALSPDVLPEPPQELSLARRDSVVPRQATPPQTSWAFNPWGTPPEYDPAEVWDSTEEHSFTSGLPDEKAIAPAVFEAPSSLDKKVLAEQVASLDDRYLTPAGPLTPGLAPVRRLRRTAKMAQYAALGFIALLGIAAVVSQPHGPNSTGGLTNSSQSTLDDRSDSAAGRSQERGAASPTPSASVTASSAAPKATATKKATPKSTVVALVAGMDRAQMTNAQTIVRTGQKLGVPQRGLLIGLMTAMQESNLYNQASNAVPESFDYPHQGDSADYDSCGLFQQRTSMGWGTVKQIMDPVYSSTKFFKSLLDVSGWQNMELTLAAQEVQGSAFPYAYAKHESRARTILNALT